jgi:hypothetical protein
MLGHLKGLCRNRASPETSISRAYLRRMFALESEHVQVEDSDDSDEDLNVANRRLGGIDLDSIPVPLTAQRHRPDAGVSVPNQSVALTHLAATLWQEATDVMGHQPVRVSPGSTSAAVVKRVSVKGEMRRGNIKNFVQWGLQVPLKRLYTTAICVVVSTELPLRARLVFGNNPDEEVVGFVHRFLVFGPSPHTGDSVDASAVLADVTLTRTTQDDYTKLPLIDVAEVNDCVRVLMPAQNLGRVMAVGPTFDWDEGSDVWTVLEVGRGYPDK